MSAFTRKKAREEDKKVNLTTIIEKIKKKYKNRNAIPPENLEEKLPEILKKIHKQSGFTNDLKGEEALLNKLQKNHNFQNVRALSFNYRNQLPALIKKQESIIGTRKGTTSTATSASNRNKTLANLAKKYQTLARNIRGIKTGGLRRKKNRTYRK